MGLIKFLNTEILSIVKNLLLNDGRFPLENELSAVERSELDTVFTKAQKALKVIEGYDQKTVDRLCQAVAWSVANKQTFLELVDMGIEESKLGDPVSPQGKRFKIIGCLRDALSRNQSARLKKFRKKVL